MNTADAPAIKMVATRTMFLKLSMNLLRLAFSECSLSRLGSLYIKEVVVLVSIFISIVLFYNLKINSFCLKFRMLLIENLQCFTIGPFLLK